MKELFSKSVERALLGLLIKKPDFMSDISGAIDADDFYVPENKALFKSIEKSYETIHAADKVLVIDTFAKEANISIDEAKEFIASITIDAGIESNLQKYVTLLREKTKQRNVKLALEDSSMNLHKTDNSAIEIIGEIESKLSEISQDSELRNLSDIETLTGEFYANIEKFAADGISSGISTGFRNFDRRIGGFRSGQFVIVAARPSVGKTAFSLALSQSIAKNYKVAFFSLEMPSDQLILRMATNHSRIPGSRIERLDFINQNEELSFKESLTKIKSLNLWLDDSASITMPELAWKARKLKKENGLDIIFIDYLQLITGNKRLLENRQQAVSEISKQLKELARELEIPVVALSQLSRKVEERTSKRPLMSDIRESGSIEQDADIIIFLHREDYQKEDGDHQPQSSTSELEVIIAKHRNGQTGSVFMEMDKAHGALKEKQFNAKGPVNN